MEWSATLDEFLVEVSQEGVRYEQELDLSPQERALLQRLKWLADQHGRQINEDRDAA